MTEEQAQQQPGMSVESSPHDAQAISLEGPCATWLTRELLLAFGPFSMPADAGDAIVTVNDTDLGGRFTSIALPVGGSQPFSGSDQRPQWTLLMAVVTDRHLALGTGSVSLRARSETAPAVELSLTDLGELNRACKTALDPRDRERALQFVTSSARASGSSSVALSKRLLIVREALRRRPDVVVSDPATRRGAAIEILVAASDTAFYGQGWMRDDEAPITRLTAISPEGDRIEILEGLFRYTRPDVEERYGDSPHLRGVAKPGFVGFFELEAPSYLEDGWVLEMENSAGTEVGITTPRVVSDVVLARRAILENLPFHALPDEWLMSTKVFPALETLQERARELATVASVTDYGAVREDADVSIVIPLYRQIRFLEHQLAQFAHDPELAQAELVFVLDSPELDKELRDYASHLFRLYRIPFRVVTMARGSGYAAATNHGVRESSGRLLLLLNSDVIPDRTGWLGRMQEFYDSQDNIGALGVKLLYEDDALQHAGMYFQVVDDTALAGAWANVHYFKGMNRDLAPANVTRRVPAVTGACLMISRDLLEQVGGLPDVYVQGDHEDSELCLRLIEAGRENWYLADVELYHLEGQSYESALRGMTALYNRWLHTRRWGDLIATVMAEYPSPGAVDGAPSDTFPAQQAGAGLPARR